jgi:hypothetical protein
MTKERKEERERRFCPCGYIRRREQFSFEEKKKFNVSQEWNGDEGKKLTQGKLDDNKKRKAKRRGAELSRQRTKERGERTEKRYYSKRKGKNNRQERNG